MHAKTDSDLTSLANSSPPHSPRRPAYYVMSPSNAEHERISIEALSPAASPSHRHFPHHPSHHRYASSPIHHSRESSTTRFSASLKNGYWRKIPKEMVDGAEGKEGEEEEEDDGDWRWGFRCYVVLFVLGFVLLFSLFSVILWGASKAYQPDVSVKSLVFERYNIQAGMDLTGVPTKMISINSTVKIMFRNPATFFGVHVSASQLQMFYFDLVIAYGHMKEFYVSRKNDRVLLTAIHGKEVPLYGGGATLTSRNNGGPPAVIPFQLTFVVRARANILGRLVRSRFDRAVRCSIYFREDRLGRPVDLRRACEYG